MEDEKKVVFDKVHAARLTQLAEHLEHGELGHEEFDFSVYNQSDGEAKCGTAGCAIGECPVLWPKDWNWGLFGQPTLEGCGETDESGMRWFGLADGEFSHLFVPHFQRPHEFGGECLGIMASRYQVAANIRAFLAIKGQQANQDTEG